MASIFISYRRDDTSGYCGRINEHLVSTFGRNAVFMDLDDIDPGVNFVRAIDESLLRCDVMLVLIGKGWLDARDASGRRRIDNPDDFVRIEVAKALERNIRVIPVLVNKASIPSEKDLPGPLKGLANIQAIELSDDRWNYDLAQLLHVIRGSKTRRRWIAVALAIVALLVAGYGFMRWRATSPTAFAGEWVAEFKYDFGVQYRERFVFRVDGGRLGGVASFLGVDRVILEGEIKDDRVSFVTHSEEILGEIRREAQHRYRGTLAKDEIHLVMQTEGGTSEHPPVEATARRK
jgi:hypothetical protein